MTAGPVSQTDLARRWGVSRQRVSQLVAEPGFPAPVMTIDRGRRFLYDPVACSEWRANRRPPGRPRKQAA